MTSKHTVRPQFSLRSLMGFTTGLCLLFAILSALRVHPLQVLAAFGLCGIGAVWLISVVEAWQQLNGKRG